MSGVSGFASCECQVRGAGAGLTLSQPDDVSDSTNCECPIRKWYNIRQSKIDSGGRYTDD